MLGAGGGRGRERGKGGGGGGRMPGMTFHQNPSSVGLNRAICHIKRLELMTTSCEGKNKKKILLLVMKVSAVTSTLDDVLVTSYINNTQIF
jgi:hypothetical protein